MVWPDSVRLCGTLEIRLAPWVGCTMNSVREAVHVDAVLGPHAVGPVLRQLHAVATGHVVAGAARVLGADLEARRVDDAVDLVVARRRPRRRSR